MLVKVSAHNNYALGCSGENAHQIGQGRAEDALLREVGCSAARFGEDLAEFGGALLILDVHSGEAALDCGGFHQPVPFSGGKCGEQEEK